MADRFGLGMNESDFGWLANQYNPATLDQGAQELAVANEQIQKMADTGARMAAQSKAEEVPPLPQSYQVKTKPDGSTEVSISGLSPDQIAYFQKAASFYQEALGGYAQEAQRLEAQQRQAEGQPWQQLATALSANLAQAKDMPGWVQGLGRTAAQLNPTVDEIRARKLAVLGKGAEMGEKGMALGIAQQRTLEDKAMRQDARLMQAESQRQKLVKEAYDNLAQAVDKGPGMMNGKTAASVLTKAGATADELGPLLDQLGNLAANVGKAFEIKRDDVLKAQTFAADQERRRTRIAEEGLDMERKRLRQSEERMKQAEFLSEKSDYTRNTSLQVGEQQAIQTAFNALNLVGKMEEIAKTKKIGPITGRVEYLNPYRDAEWQQIKNYADQLLLSGLNGKLGAGVSDRDVTLMRSVMPNGKMTQPQFDATTKVMRSLNPDNISRLMQSNPNVQYWSALKPQFEKFGLGKLYETEMDRMLTQNAVSYPNLFGADRPAIAERTFGAHTKAAPRASEGVPTGVEEMLRQNPGKGVKDEQGRIWTMKNGQIVLVQTK